MKCHGLPGDDVGSGVEAGVGNVYQRSRPGGRGTNFEVVSR